MREGRFEWDIYLEKQPQEVLALLSDFNRHTLIHPLIIAVKQVEAPSGVLKRFLITDQIQWGPVRFKIQYRADILRITDSEVHTRAYQSPEITIDNLTRVIPEGTGSRLKETITLKAPGVLFSYTFIQAKTAHQTMLKRIKTILESQGKAQ